MFVTNHLTEFNGACNLPRIDEWAAIGLFKDFTADPAPAAIKARLKLSNKDANKHERISRHTTEWITTYWDVKKLTPRQLSPTRKFDDMGPDSTIQRQARQIECLQLVCIRCELQFLQNHVRMVGERPGSNFRKYCTTNTIIIALVRQTTKTCHKGRKPKETRFVEREVTDTEWQVAQSFWRSKQRPSVFNK